MNTVLENMAMRLPDASFAFLLTRFYSRDTKICRQDGGWLIERGGLKLLSPTPKCLFMRPNEFAAKFYRYFRIEPGEVAVDIGACYGDTTVPMVLAVGPTGRVIAIEPSPTNAHFLQKNLSQYPNTAIFQRAVWSSKCQVPFWLHSAPTGGSIQHGYGRDTRIEVEADTIDNILADTKVDFLKIDVQGVEAEVLKGAIETLKRVPKVIVETHYRMAPEKTYPAVLEEMRKYDFDLHFVMETGLVHALKR